MCKLLKKLTGRKGETFAEILISILVVAFGCALIAVLFTTSLHLNVEADRNDTSYYGAVSEMEQMLDSEGITGSKEYLYLTDSEGNEIEKSIDVFGNDTNSAYKNR